MSETLMVVKAKGALEQAIMRSFFSAQHSTATGRSWAKMTN